MKEYGMHITSVRPSKFGCESLDVRRGERLGRGRRFQRVFLAVSVAALAWLLGAIALGVF